MKRFASIPMVILVLVSVAPAQFMPSNVPGSGTMAPDASNYETQKDVITGYLMDANCAEAHRGALAGMAVGHPTECLLESASSGFGIVSNNIWVPFDATGSKKAMD